MIDLATLKEFLNIGDENSDSFLLKVIDMASSKLAGMCNRELNYGTRTDIISGSEESIIYTDNYPVDRILHIKYRGDTGGFTGDVLRGNPMNDNIYLDRTNGMIILLNGYTLPAGEKNIQIKYYAGYTIDAPVNECELPADLKSAAMMIAAEIFLKGFREFPYEYGGRLGLRHYQHILRDGTNESSRIFTYKGEDYSDIINRYKKTRI